jgi:hypothetical protein
MLRHNLLIAALFALSALPAQAAEPCRTWDKVEDTAEKGGSWVEKNWEKLEDAVIPETAEEKREEAQERREDAAEEAAEERCKRS